MPYSKLRTFYHVHERDGGESALVLQYSTAPLTNARVLKFDSRRKGEKDRNRHHHQSNTYGGSRRSANRKNQEDSGDDDGNGKYEVSPRAARETSLEISTEILADVTLGPSSSSSTSTTTTTMGSSNYLRSTSPMPTHGGSGGPTARAASIDAALMNGNTIALAVGYSGGGIVRVSDLSDAGWASVCHPSASLISSIRALHPSAATAASSGGNNNNNSNATGGGPNNHTFGASVATSTGGGSIVMLTNANHEHYYYPHQQQQHQSMPLSSPPHNISLLPNLCVTTVRWNPFFGGQLLAGYNAFGHVSLYSTTQSASAALLSTRSLRPDAANATVVAAEWAPCGLSPMYHRRKSKVNRHKEPFAASTGFLSPSHAAVSAGHRGVFHVSVLDFRSASATDSVRLGTNVSSSPSPAAEAGGRFSTRGSLIGGVGGGGTASVVASENAAGASFVAQQSSAVAPLPNGVVVAASGLSFHPTLPLLATYGNTQLRNPIAGNTTMTDKNTSKRGGGDYTNNTASPTPRPHHDHHPHHQEPIICPIVQIWDLRHAAMPIAQYYQQELYYSATAAASASATHGGGGGGFSGPQLGGGYSSLLRTSFDHTAGVWEVMWGDVDEEEYRSSNIEDENDYDDDIFARSCAPIALFGAQPFVDLGAKLAASHDAREEEKGGKRVAKTDDRLAGGSVNINLTKGSPSPPVGTSDIGIFDTRLVTTATFTSANDSSGNGSDGEGAHGGGIIGGGATHVDALGPRWPSSGSFRLKDDQLHNAGHLRRALPAMVSGSVANHKAPSVVSAVSAMRSSQQVGSTVAAITGAAASAGGPSSTQGLANMSLLTKKIGEPLSSIAPIGNGKLVCQSLQGFLSIVDISEVRSGGTTRKPSSREDRNVIKKKKCKDTNVSSSQRKSDRCVTAAALNSKLHQSLHTIISSLPNKQPLYLSRADKGFGINIYKSGCVIAQEAAVVAMVLREMIIDSSSSNHSFGATKMTPPPNSSARQQAAEGVDQFFQNSYTSYRERVAWAVLFSFIHTYRQRFIKANLINKEDGRLSSYPRPATSFLSGGEEGKEKPVSSSASCGGGTPLALSNNRAVLSTFLPQALTSYEATLEALASSIQGDLNAMDLWARQINLCSKFNSRCAAAAAAAVCESASSKRKERRVRSSSSKKQITNKGKEKEKKKSSKGQEGGGGDEAVEEGAGGVEDESIFASHVLLGPSKTIGILEEAKLMKYEREARLQQQSKNSNSMNTDAKIESKQKTATQNVSELSALKESLHWLHFPPSSPHPLSKSVKEDDNRDKSLPRDPTVSGVGGGKHARARDAAVPWLAPYTNKHRRAFISLINGDTSLAASILRGGGEGSGHWHHDPLLGKNEEEDPFTIEASLLAYMIEDLEREVEVNQRKGEPTTAARDTVAPTVDVISQTANTPSSVLRIINTERNSADTVLSKISHRSAAMLQDLRRKLLLTFLATQHNSANLGSPHNSSKNAVVSMPAYVPIYLVLMIDILRGESILELTLKVWGRESNDGQKRNVDTLESQSHAKMKESISFSDLCRGCPIESSLVSFDLFIATSTLIEAKGEEGAAKDQHHNKSTTTTAKILPLEKEKSNFSTTDLIENISSSSSFSSSSSSPHLPLLLLVEGVNEKSIHKIDNMLTASSSPETLQCLLAVFASCGIEYALRPNLTDSSKKSLVTSDASCRNGAVPDTTASAASLSTWVLWHEQYRSLLDASGEIILRAEYDLSLRLWYNFGLVQDRSGNVAPGPSVVDVEFSHVCECPLRANAEKQITKIDVQSSSGGKKLSRKTPISALNTAENNLSSALRDLALLPRHQGDLLGSSYFGLERHRCKSSLPKCGVCGISAESMPSPLQDPSEWFAWCTSCGHGGHAAHLDDWFSRHHLCPFPMCPCSCRTTCLLEEHQRKIGEHSEQGQGQGIVSPSITTAHHAMQQNATTSDASAVHTNILAHIARSGLGNVDLQYQYNGGSGGGLVASTPALCRRPLTSSSSRKLSHDGRTPSSSDPWGEMSYYFTEYPSAAALKK